MNRQEWDALLSNSECLASESEVDIAINEMAAKINEDFIDQNPIMLTVMNGGLVTAGKLLPKLQMPVECDYIHATRYGDHTTGQKLQWKARPTLDLGGRSVLIVDDIYDVGETLIRIVEDCMKIGAVSVSTAVLVDKQHDRKFDTSFVPDYVGMVMPDRFLFGSGMDVKGYGRNAPGLYALD